MMTTTCIFSFEESNDEEDSDEDTDRHVLVGDLQCEETQVDDEVDLDYFVP